MIKNIKFRKEGDARGGWTSINREFNVKLKKAKVQKTRTKTEEIDIGKQKLILI
jgi:hypothetical protein